MKKIILGLLLCLLAAPASAQTSTAQPVLPGYNTTAGCPGGAPNCFISVLTGGVTTQAVTVNSGHAQVLAANVAKVYLMLHNPSAAGGDTIYCRADGSSAALNAAGTMAIAPGQYLTFEGNGVIRAAIDCLAAHDNIPMTIGTN